MRIPLIPLLASAGLIGGSISFATGTWKWALPVGAIWVSFVFLAEWCVDAIVREIKRSRFRA